MTRFSHAGQGNERRWLQWWTTWCYSLVWCSRHDCDGPSVKHSCRKEKRVVLVVVAYFGDV